jgi:hypothetical protein
MKIPLLFAMGGLHMSDLTAADISALETQLDAAVAKLYGLAPEEIAIVEGEGKV